MTFEQRIRENLPALVLVMVAGGFALTAGELLLMHHTEGKQIIGVAATGAGALVGLAGIWLKGTGRKAVAVVFAALALTGLFGLVEHLEGEDEDEREGFRWEQPAQAWVTSQTAAFAEEEEEEEREGHEGEKGEHGPPPLAPLSVTGLALLGAVGVLAKQD